MKKRKSRWSYKMYMLMEKNRIDGPLKKKACCQPPRFSKMFKYRKSLIVLFEIDKKKSCYQRGIVGEYFIHYKTKKVLIFVFVYRNTVSISVG